MTIQNPEASKGPQAWYVEYPGATAENVAALADLMNGRLDEFYEKVDRGEGYDVPSGFLTIDRPGFDDGGRRTGDRDPAVEAMLEEGFLELVSPGAAGISQKFEDEYALYDNPDNIRPVRFGTGAQAEAEYRLAKRLLPSAQVGVFALHGSASETLERERLLRAERQNRFRGPQ